MLKWFCDLWWIFIHTAHRAAAVKVSSVPHLHTLIFRKLCKQRQIHLESVWAGKE